MVVAMPPPVPFNEEQAQQVLLRLEDGRTATSISQDPDMPTYGTIISWSTRGPDWFVEQYERCRRVGYMRWADEMVDISDGVDGDGVRDSEGRRVALVEGVNPATGEVELVPRPVQRDKLRIDTRQWVLAKALPKIFGDLVRVQGTLELEQRHRLDFSELPPADRATIREILLRNARLRRTPGEDDEPLDLLPEPAGA